MCRLMCHCVRHISLDNKHGRSVEAIHSSRHEEARVLHLPRVMRRFSARLFGWVSWRRRPSESRVEIFLSKKQASPSGTTADMYASTKRAGMGLRRRYRSLLLLFRTQTPISTTHLHAVHSERPGCNDPVADAVSVSAGIGTGAGTGVSSNDQDLLEASRVQSVLQHASALYT